ncbi:MAG: polymer-forming cytoskeletal protein [Ignavibacteria bacterium]|nr:polymer-forming cytoskeletal protein [Ignavibacteria bacterium]
MNFNLKDMFGNKSKEQDPKENSYVEESRPVSRTTVSQDKVLTLISEGCKFEGNLSSPSTTKIDGHVVGNLRGESGIIIGEKGIVEGNVNAVDVTVYGTVKGNIKAHKLELKRTGVLEGDTNIEILVAESGSKFSGNSKMGELKPKSNIIDMKDPDVEIHDESKEKEKPVLKFH